MDAHTPTREWYESNTGNHQGLIIEYGSGKNIAITYDKADAAFIVRAVNRDHVFDELVAALKDSASSLIELTVDREEHKKSSSPFCDKCNGKWPCKTVRGYYQARAALAKLDATKGA